MRFPTIIPAAVLLAGMSTPLAAQVAEEGVVGGGESEHEGDEILIIEPGDHDYIVVHGGVLARPNSDNADPVDYISMPDQGTGIRVENIVRDIPGWQQFRRSDARSANPTSQGLTARGLGGNAASRTMLLLDGIPQTDPFGGWVNWTAFDAVSLRGIRIVHGGGSGADGPGALAGTIEMSSSRDSNKYAAIAYGSRDSIDGDFQIGMRPSDGSIIFSGNYSRGDGFIPIIASQRGVVDMPAQYESYGLGARFILPLNTTGNTLQATIRAFNDNRSRGVPFSDNHNSGVDANVRLLTGVAGMPTMLIAYAQLRDFSSQFGSVSANRATVTPTLDQFDVPSTGVGARFEIRPLESGLNENNEVRLGLDWRRNSGRTYENFTYVSGVPTRRREAGGVGEYVGTFAEWSGGIDHLDLAASLRGDRWSIRDGQRREVDIGGGVRSDDHFADRSGWEWTGRVAANWWFTDPLYLKVSAYHGWRMPTLNELYRPFRVGLDAVAANEALDIERIDGVEARLETNLDGVSANAVLFYNRLDNAIANVTMGQGPGTFPGVGFVAAGGIYRKRQNLDAIVSKGIELDASIDLTRDLTFKLGYAYVDARVKGTGVAAALDGLRPAQVPSHSGNASLSYDDGDFSASATLRYIGRQFEDDANSLALKDALTADLALGHRIGDKIRVEVRGENLLDAQVQAAISSTGIIERASPRTVWVGVRWNFE